MVIQIFETKNKFTFYNKQSNHELHINVQIFTYEQHLCPQRMTSQRCNSQAIDQGSTFLDLVPVQIF